MKRRTFLKTVGALLSVGMLAPARALCKENDALVALTPTRAEEIALSFLESFCPDRSYATEPPMPLYDLSGNMIGCVVNLTYGGNPSGYVVLDVGHPSLIAQVCLEENSFGPLNRLISRGDEHGLLSLSEEPYLIKINPIEFAIGQHSNDCLLVSDGKTVPVPNSLQRNVPAMEWRDLMIPDIYSGYDVDEVIYGATVGALGESEIRQATGHYACAVTALYCIATSLPYPSYTSFERFLIEYDDYDQYMTIWEDTSTDGVWDGDRQYW